MNDGSAPAGRVPGRRQGEFWLGVLLSAALGLGGAAFATGAYLADRQPATVVRAYFDALARGDAAAALGYGDVPAGQRGLLTAGVLAAQRAVAPIAGLSIAAVDVHRDTADIDVKYTLRLASGPQAVLDRVAVVRRGHGWRLAHSAVPVSLRTGNGSARASLAGGPVPTGSFAMFPGATPVVFDTPNLELATTARVVKFVAPPDIVVQADVSTAGREAIVPALGAALTACLAGRSRVQAICPTPDPAAAVPGTLRGTMTWLDADLLYLLVASADGRIDIAGTAKIAAKFSDLDDNDLPVSTNATAVGMHAHSSAVHPGAIEWDRP